MAISLVQPKERHTGIWCLLVKYLLWQCAMWTTFGKHNYFDLFFEQLVQALWTGRYESFFGTFQRTTYWNLVPTGEVFALAVCYVDNFWETQLLWPIFEQLVQALWTGRYEYFFRTFQRTTYWNLVPTGEVFALVVVCGQLLGNVSTLADFRTVGASTLNRTLRNFLWNISKNNILEFGIYCLPGQCSRWTFLGKCNLLGRFWNSSW